MLNLFLTGIFWPAVGADQEFFERVCRRRGDEVKILGLFICRMPCRKISVSYIPQLQSLTKSLQARDFAYCLYMFFQQKSLKFTSLEPYLIKINMLTWIKIARQRRDLMGKIDLLKFLGFVSILHEESFKENNIDWLHILCHSMGIKFTLRLDKWWRKQGTAETRKLWEGGGCFMHISSYDKSPINI